MALRFTIAVILISSFILGADQSMVLESRETLIIKSISQAEYTVYKKIVIHDEKGKDLASVSIGSSDYVELKSVKVTVFDGKGKRRGRYKKKHFSKHKSSAYGIIGNDDISYEINLSAVTNLPFTIELEYTQTINSLFFWPNWSPQTNIPVLSASYTLEVPPGYGFSSFSPSGISNTQPSENTYVWNQLAVPPWPDEIAIPPEVYDRYRVFFAPDTFKVDMYSGSMSTWQGVADFYESLAQTQYELNPESVGDLEFGTATTLKDSISQIYDYVQNATRYVGMELGIHGWKPHSSQWVCENKYGDCKDLATFFISLLKMHGIEAYPVLILSRSHGVIYPEFPNSRFNHAIACVPLENDTLWVDCTDDDGRIDIVSRGNQGCNVVVVGGSAPVLKQTPIQEPDLNAVTFEGDIDLRMNGSAFIKGRLKLIGHASKDTRSAFQSVIRRDQREAILSLFSETAPGMVLDTFSVKNLDDKYAPMEIYVEGDVPHFATQTGSRYFVFPALPYKAGWYGEHPSRRTEPFFAGIPSLSSAEIDIHVSDNWELESIPPDVEMKNSFGEIQQHIAVEDDAIHYSWRRTKMQVLIQPEEYQEYYNYRLKAKQAQSSAVVFRQR